MHVLVSLAKEAVEKYIKEKKVARPSIDLPKEFLEEKSGVFVTIEKDGELRGCIGTYLSTKENIAEEVIYNAIAAATEDYRFGMVEERELPFLSYAVYILSVPEPVKDIKELNPQKYGIIVKTLPILPSKQSDVLFNGSPSIKTGLLLPDLEGVDTIEKQIAIASQKAGINPLEEKIVIYRFTVEKYK